MKDEIQRACINAIKHLVDKEAEVTIDVTSQVTTYRQDNGAVLPNVKNIIAVASGKGGVGKSTVAVNLALGLAKQGSAVGLIDADIYGPSIPTMLNLKGRQPMLTTINGQQKILPIEQYGIKTLSIGFLADEKQAVVWRGPMASSALRQFITDSHWGDLDYLVIDLPPGTGDIHLTLAQLVPITGAIIVTTPQDVAKADVVKAIGMFRLPQINVPILGLVENMAYFVPPDMPDKKYFIFGQGAGQSLCDEYNLPYLAQLPINASVCEHGDNGLPVVMSNDPAAAAFEDLAQRTAQQVAIRNANLAATQPIVMK
jgi:ATP-binding protein involved in chromosome partitioning